MTRRTMKANSGSNTETNVKTIVREFELTSDQPKESGGTDEGPSPVEYALASLGSCICTMAHMVAAKMGLKIDSVKTRVEGDLDHIGVVDPDRVRPGFLEVRLKVEIEGDIGDEKKELIMNEAENKCPVTDSLKNPVNVKFELLQ